MQWQAKHRHQPGFGLGYGKYGLVLLGNDPVMKLRGNLALLPIRNGFCHQPEQCEYSFATWLYVHYYMVQTNGPKLAGFK
jgi:hypothetical protein